MTTSQRGELSEAKVLSAFLVRGVHISIPWGNAQPYDLIVDVQGKLLRVQVKTATQGSRENILSFNCCSETRGRKRVGYHGRADLYAVYAPQIDQVFVVPVKDCGTSKAYIRIADAKTKGAYGFRMASACSIDTWMKEMVGSAELESAAFSVSRKRSNQLSYDPMSEKNLPAIGR